MKKIIITGAITLGILGIYGYNTFAIDVTQNNDTYMQNKQQYCNLAYNNIQHHNNGNGCYHIW